MVDRILIDPEVQHGKPLIRGTRVPVSRIVGGVARGMSPEEVVREYGVTAEDLRAALRYASELIERTEVKSLSDVQENLALLYLRLNGFLVSGFIAHAPEPHGNLAEIDVLAVRFPHKAEPEREVEPSPYLQVSSEHIDLIIAEVKGKNEALQFNSSLRSAEAVRKVLRWLGAFTKEEIDGFQDEVLGALTPRQVNSPESFPIILGPSSYRIRPILFAPDPPAPRPNQIRYIHGEEIMTYVSKCLRAEKPRPACATRYDFGLWREFGHIVRYFKDTTRGVPGTVDDLSGYLGVA